MSYNEFEPYDGEDVGEPASEGFWTIVITTVLAGVGFAYALSLLAP